MEEIFDLAWQHPLDPAFGPKRITYTCGWACHMCNWTINIKHQNLMDPNMLLKHANIKHSIKFGTNDWTMLMTSAIFIHRPTKNGQLPLQLIIPPVVPPTTFCYTGSPDETAAVQRQENGQNMNKIGGAEETKELIEKHKRTPLQPGTPIPPPNAHHIQRFAQNNLNPGSMLGSGPFMATEHPIIKSFPDGHTRASTQNTGSTALERLADIVTRVQAQFPKDPNSARLGDFLTTLAGRENLPSPPEIGLTIVNPGTIQESGLGGNGAANQGNRPYLVPQRIGPPSHAPVTEARAQAHGHTPGLDVSCGTSQCNEGSPTTQAFSPPQSPGAQPYNQHLDGNDETIREEGRVLDSNSNITDSAPINPDSSSAYTAPVSRSYATAMIGMQDYLPKPEDLLFEAYADFHAPYKQLGNPLVLAERREPLPKVNLMHSKTSGTSGFRPQPYEPMRFGGDPEAPLTKARRLNDERVITNMSRRAQEGPRYNGPPHDPKRHIAVYAQDYLNSLTGHDIELLKNHHRVHNSEPGRPLQGFNLCTHISTPAESNLTADPVHGTLMPSRYGKKEIHIGMRSLNDSDPEVIASRKSCLLGADINSDAGATGSDENVYGTGHAKGSNSEARQKKQKYISTGFSSLKRQRR